MVYNNDADEAQTAKSFVMSILAFTSGMFVSLPLSYSIVMDLIALMHSSFVEWDYNNAPAAVKFNMGITCKVLGQVQHLVISKSSIMSHNVKKVKLLKIRDVKYEDELTAEDVFEEEKSQFNRIEAGSPMQR